MSYIDIQRCKHDYICLQELKKYSDGIIIPFYKIKCKNCLKEENYNRNFHISIFNKYKKDFICTDKNCNGYYETCKNKFGIHSLHEKENITKKILDNLVLINYDDVIKLDHSKLTKYMPFDIKTYLWFIIDFFSKIYYSSEKYYIPLETICSCCLCLHKKYDEDEETDKFLLSEINKLYNLRKTDNIKEIITLLNINYYNKLDIFNLKKIIDYINKYLTDYFCLKDQTENNKKIMQVYLYLIAESIKFDLN